MLLPGRCHCGNISFVLNWEPTPVEIPARACTCTFCVKHGGVWTSCPSGSLNVHVENLSHVSRYSFGTKTARFHICSICGVTPLVTSRIEGRLYAVVSVNALENVEQLSLKRATASFDGEDEPARLSRRARNWIPEVEYANSDA